MATEYVDGKLVANVASRQEPLDEALEAVAMLAGKSADSLAPDELGRLLYYILVRQGLNSEVKLAAPSGRCGPTKFFQFFQLLLRWIFKT